MFGADFVNPEHLKQFIIGLPGLLIGLTFHEYAHALVADYLGDDTPRYQGRLTINPFRHLDPIGFLLLFAVGFGWAKPVIVNPVNFRRSVTIRQGMMLVSAAGPAMNLLIAAVAGIAFGTLSLQPLTENINIAMTILYPAVWYNVLLAFFNLIPVPPLDGSKILAGIVPDRFSSQIYKLERYGYLILIFLMITGLITSILMPIIEPIVRFLISLPMG